MAATHTQWCLMTPHTSAETVGNGWTVNMVSNTTEPIAVPGGGFTGRPSSHRRIVYLYGVVMRCIVTTIFQIEISLELDTGSSLLSEDLVDVKIPVHFGLEKNLCPDSHPERKIFTIAFLQMNGKCCHAFNACRTLCGIARRTCAKWRRTEFEFGMEWNVVVQSNMKTVRVRV